MKFLYLCVFILYSIFGYADDCEPLIQQLGQQAVQLYKNTQKGLRSKNKETRLTALNHIRELGPVDKDTYEYIISFLEDPDPDIRRAVVEIVGEHRDCIFKNKFSRLLFMKIHRLIYNQL